MSVGGRSADVVFLTWRGRRARTPARDVYLLLIPCHMDQNKDFIPLDLRLLNRISKGIRLGIFYTDCNRKLSGGRTMFFLLSEFSSGWTVMVIIRCENYPNESVFNMSIITLFSARDVRVCK